MWRRYNLRLERKPCVMKEQRLATFHCFMVPVSKRFGASSPLLLALVEVRRECFVVVRFTQ